MSLGIYTGITTTQSWDDGISKDPRYKANYTVKFAPVGLNFGMDYEGFGFVVSPGIFNMGQDFFVVNTFGGQNGLRKNEFTYLNIPFAFKLPIMKLSFFRVSAMAAFGGAYLLSGRESISHGEARLKFPTEVYPILPDDYTIEYDGVITPVINDLTMISKEDLHWRASLDFRVNYGLNDPRNDEYLIRLNDFQTLYDLPGTRKDTFAQLSIGIARYIDLDKGEQDRRKRIKNEPRHQVPMKYPSKRNRSSKPRG